MNDDTNDMTEPPIAGSDPPAVMGRAVRAARDLLATLAESGEGVSLVTILTKAVLENRMARERDAAPTAAPATDAPTPDPDPAPDAASDGDPFLRGAPDPAPRAGAGIGRKTDPPENTEPVDDSTVGDTVPDDTAADDAAADGPGPAVVRADAPPDPETEERYDAQMGARVARTETFYPNLVAFVECFLAHVLPFHQSASSHIQWVPDWWRHPALVFPLDAIWRSYETSRRSPGQMMIWYIQAASMLDRVFDKDRGIVASIDARTITTAKGEPLPCERPSRGWRAPIVDMLSVPKPRHGDDSVDIDDDGNKED